jgi:hypothetical protein
VKNLWENGPLPKGTYGCGGVTLKSENPKSGFHFAVFLGDHVKLPQRDKQRVEAADVGAYNNALTYPPIPGAKAPSLSNVPDKSSHPDPRNP